MKKILLVVILSAFCVSGCSSLKAWFKKEEPIVEPIVKKDIKELENVLLQPHINFIPQQPKDMTETEQQ